ncbi:hypothetical protein LJK88_33690 [Paenibacillus sp. P26]|nr:hypothetical protein LJK88_33690 [Paenibacillus sp. P26]
MPALTSALEKIISDPMYRYQLARVALDKALKSYSMTTVVQHCGACTNRTGKKSRSKLQKGR